jgi:16S rRNA (guanine966-N2)-methyltransferase
MRILAGSLRGRAFDQPKTTAVRPLAGKVLAAIFDVVGSPEGFAVLDTYAGSGAAGFEALSRGAVMAEGIEANASVARVIERNAATLGVHWGYVLHGMTVEKWLALPANQPDAPQRQARYQLIVADPPYAQLDADTLDRLGHFLLPGGVLVVSHSSKKPSPQLQSAAFVKAKIYGDTALSFYKAA